MNIKPQIRADRPLHYLALLVGDSFHCQTNFRQSTPTDLAQSELTVEMQVEITPDYPAAFEEAFRSASDFFMIHILQEQYASSHSNTVNETSQALILMIKMVSHIKQLMKMNHDLLLKNIPAAHCNHAAQEVVDHFSENEQALRRSAQ